MIGSYFFFTHYEVGKILTLPCWQLCLPGLGVADARVAVFFAVLTSSQKFVSGLSRIAEIF